MRAEFRALAIGASALRARSRFLAALGMTDRKASATAKTKARARARANTGVSPLRRAKGATPVEMTVFGGG